jgi:fused signal recognition particle receptor
MSFFKRLFGKNKDQSEEQVDEKASLDAGLEKSKKGVISRIARVFSGRRKIDDQLLDDLEEALMMSDVGVDTTERIIERLRKRAVWEAYLDQSELINMLREEIAHLLVGEDLAKALTKNTIFSEGKKVMLGAADTFRAAAVDQLKIWGERVGVPVISQGMGADPAAVAYDTLESAKAQNMDVVIIDTAGRLHNKVGLMSELTKIKRVLDKIVPGAPHEVWLVLDGSTGQNALVQATQFSHATDITGLILTKLDGTAKGGAVIAVCDQVKIPVHYIGVGEKMEDLQDFNPLEFIDSLLPESLDEK